METKKKILIKNLTLPVYRNLVDNLEHFWLSKTLIVKPLHHPIFSLLFSDVSFVLYYEKLPVSYIICAYNNNKGFIHFMATRPEFYKKGFASLLFQRLEKKAHIKNLRSLWAYTVPGNLSSEKFLTAHGFIVRKEIRISSDDRRILYRKLL